KSKNSVLFEKFKNDKFISLSQIKTNISQGIRTSGNEIYVVDFISQEDNLLQVYSKALNKIVTIESNLASLFLQGKEIKPYKLLYSSKLLIIPYELTNGNVHLINEEKLR
ncbi:MAG: hypothetical protein ACYT04_87325, partial [Nostoc sp.]